MKKFRLALIVGALILATVGILSLKKSHDYQANATEINLLLAQARSKGFATAGEDFVKKLPDADNAWIEIAPILMKQENGKQGKYIYTNEYASSLIASGQLSDETIFQESLDLNRSDREMILRALKSKRGFQIPRNYNEGYAMLYPDLARLKVLAKDICLDAVYHAMHRDSGGMLSRLDAAYLLGSELMSQKDELSRLVGVSIFSIVSNSNLRIVELDPSMTGLIKDRAKTWSPKFEQDPFDTFEWYFLEQMAMCRNFDDPILDRPQLGFPFDKIFKPVETQDFDKWDVRPSNAIPKSHAMRRYMVSLLRQWLPAINQIQDPATKRDVNTAEAIADKVDWSIDCPKPVNDFLTSMLEGTVSVSAQYSGQTKIDLLFEAIRQVEYKQTHGKYSDHVLGSIRVSDPAMKFKVTKRGNGIQIGAGIIDDEGLAQTRICIPISAGLNMKITEPSNISRLRNGSLKVSVKRADP